MNTEYQRWIAENVEGDGRGKCAEVTQAMAEAFPELRRVRGHYHCLISGERPHWWLIDPEDAIVDPTAAQFPAGGDYLPWSGIEPIGRCYNCGELVYEPASGENNICSALCYSAYRNFCMSGLT